MPAKYKFLFPIFFLLFFIFPQKTEAAFSFNIASSSATTITSGGQDVDVGLNIINLPSESYFRVSLQKESGGSYYGYVLNNNGDWAKIQTLSGDCTAYYKVIDTTVTSLLLKYKMGDDAEISNGNYNLKAHRFTKTCTSYTEATNLLSFVVSLPTPTPTPTLTPTPTALPTNTPTPTPVPTPTPTKSPTPKSTSTPLQTTSGQATSEETAAPQSIVLGLEDKSGVKEASESAEEKKSFSFLPFLFIAAGLVCIGVALFLVLKKGKAYNEESGEKS